ncbi:MAG TPA: glucose-1-phosphate adenylyltransferase subunit GlgD, partial [bacterium]|nr:glucose-1-phosphate adenylyltransferase subunit GlgD [bacterium]
MAEDLAVILAGGAGRRLLLLSERRAKPAVPFGGIYRIIDFALSNCINSGIGHVFVLSQYLPRSLWRHLNFGKPWDLDRLKAEMLILHPYVGSSESKWYEGTADAVYQNLHFIRERSSDRVLILGGDHVYKMDYRLLLDFHKKRGADVTVAVKRVRPEETTKFGTCLLDENKRIIEFEEKASRPKSNLASMGIYVFDTEVLADCLIRDAKNANSTHDFGRDIVPWAIQDRHAYGYEFNGYWQDVGTVSTYFESNMDLLRPEPPIDLDDRDWPILTNIEDLPPARLLKLGRASESMICDGSIINGTVESSIISPSVVIEEGAVVRNSIIFAGCVISRGAKINLSIVDKHVSVGQI